MDYEELHPEINIIYNADSSGTLQTQIEEGAQCDLFFSAATKQMDALQEGGYLVDGTVKNLLGKQGGAHQAQGRRDRCDRF